MLLVGQIGTTSALFAIGLVSLVVPEGTTRGFLVLALTVTFLAEPQAAAASAVTRVRARVGTGRRTGTSF